MNSNISLMKVGRYEENNTLHTCSQNSDDLQELIGPYCYEIPRGNAASRGAIGEIFVVGRRACSNCVVSNISKIFLQTCGHC